MSCSAYFQVPSCLLSHIAAIPASAVRLYLQLCFMARQGSVTVCVSTAALAKAAGLSQRTVFAALAQLERLELIARDNKGRTAVNSYRLVARDGPAEDAGVPVGDPVLAEHPGEINRCQPSPPSSTQSVVHAVGGASTQATPTESIDDLIAATYSAKCKQADVQPLVELNEADLRRCLLVLKEKGGVDERSPVTFFSAALSTVYRQLCGEWGPVGYLTSL